MADLKAVCRATTQATTENALDDLAAKWVHLSAHFKYPEYIRKVIYTTNAVETVHRQFRKLTKAKGGFPNENSLLKLLYAGILKASEKLIHQIQNWNLTLSQLAIHFEARIEQYLNL